MNRETIIQMAREAGFRSGNITLSNGEHVPFVGPVSATDCIHELERFYALAVAKEREECAKVCESRYMGDMRMVLCPKCGNKRCPHANDHRNDCTGSNEPGQPGSAYPAPHGITAKAKKE